MGRDDRIREGLLMHSINMDNRRKLVVSGVTDIAGFDESEIALFTSEGGLIVRGSELRLEKLSLDSGEVIIEGRVDALDYDDSAAPRAGFFARIFGG